MSNHLPISSSNKSVAVLPFLNMSADPENEYFSDGITEEIINALTTVQGLKVIARTSSFAFKNKNLDVRTIGSQLGVSTILEGSVRKVKNRVRVTAQFISAEDGTHFWSKNFDHDLEDIFALQDEISLHIADKIRENFGHFEIDNTLVNAPNLPVTTYELFLKGRYHLTQLTKESTEKAIAIFEEVIAAQPDFALAYLDINQGYSYLGTMGLLPAAEAFVKAKPYLDKALELDENLPESQRNLSWICGWQNWDFEGAYRHIVKAIEMRPSEINYLSIANLLSVEGRYEASTNYIDKALQLDPFSAILIHFKGFNLYLQEQYEQAIPYFEKSLSIQPDMPFPIIYLGEILLLQGKPSEALTYFENLPEKKGGGLTKLGGTTLAYAAIGDVPKTEEHIGKLEAMLETDAVGSAMQFLILVKTRMGKYEEALTILEQAITYKLPLVLLMQTEPLMKPLREHPRFQELMNPIFGKDSTLDLPKKKYKTSLLDRNLIDQYKEQLESLIAENEPYLNPELTLRELAKMIGIPPNHLSQLLNEGFDQNFSEYINSYRLETFKSKVTDPALRHLSILGLAFESGFNSKTVFNSFFKKVVGMTPKAWLNSNQT